LALLLPVTVALIVLTAPFLSGHSQLLGGIVLAVLTMYVSTAWLILLFGIFGPTALDAGAAEASKGELEVLLQRKQHGDLQVHPRTDWHKPDYADAPTPKPAASESGPALDQLLAWKRRHCPAPEREEE